MIHFKASILSGLLVAALAGTADAAPGYPSTGAFAVTVATSAVTGRVLIDPPPVMATTPRSWQVRGKTTTGSGSATATIDGGFDDGAGGILWDTLCTFTLTLSSVAVSGGCRDESSYRYYSLNITAISGTGASLSATAGY